MLAGIVVPTLGDRPDFLAECLASLAEQTSGMVETVLVTTPQAVSRVVGAFPGVPVIVQSGTGIPAAISTGWRHFGERVDALAWLGDDDRLPPRSLATALAELERHPKSVMVYGRSRYIDADGNRRSLLRPGRICVPLLRLGHNLMLQPGCLYRRSAVEAIGGLDHELRLAFDVDLHRRLIAHGRVRYVPVVLGEIRSHDGSLTVRNRSESRREVEWVISRNMPSWALRIRPVWDPGARAVTRVAARIAAR